MAKNIFKNIVKQRQIYMKIIKEPSMVAILSFYIFILIIDVWSKYINKNNIKLLDESLNECYN